MSEDLLQHAAAQGPLRDGATHTPRHAGQSHGGPPLGGAAHHGGSNGGGSHAGASHGDPSRAPAGSPASAPGEGGHARAAAAHAPGTHAAAGMESAPVPTGEDAPWYAALPDEQLRRWAQAKGWKDPLAAVESNYNLERMIGAERAGRMVAVPGENASPEELRNFRARIGVPDSAEGYALAVPEGAPADFARTAAGWMHEAGIPARSAGVLAQRWNEHLANAQAQDRARMRAQSENELAQLRSEWGGSFEANADRARRAALHFLPARDAEARTALMGKLEQSLGTATFLRFMAKAGLGLAEHRLISSGDAGLSGHYSPGDARARIAQLRADRAWTASYIAGDAGKAAEMNRLHRMAFPGGEQ
jgi:hypothetical protein